MVDERIPAELPELVRRLTAGDIAARDAVARMHEPIVVRWAGRLRRRRPWVEFDDLMAEGRLAVLESLPRFRAVDGASLATFLDAAVRRRLRDFLARTAALPQDPDGGSALERVAERPVLDPALCDRLGHVLHFLPPRWREVMTLHYGLDGEKPLSFRRVARAMGVSAQRVAQLHQSALERLRWHWE